MADEDDEGRADGATRAFEDMRAEFSVLRRGVEALPGVWEDNRPPDYTPNFVRIEKIITLFERRLASVEGQPALQRTPEQYAVAIERAGREAVAGAVQKLDQATRDTAQTGKNLAGMIGHMRGQRAQRDQLIFWVWGGLCMGFCLGLLLYNPITDAANYVISMV